jgi:hypothetical protein
VLRAGGGRRQPGAMRRHPRQARGSLGRIGPNRDDSPPICLLHRSCAGCPRAHSPRPPCPSQVVVPLSVLSSWLQELKRWCPALRVVRLHASDVDERKRLRREVNGWGTPPPPPVPPFRAPRAPPSRIAPPAARDHAATSKSRRPPLHPSPGPALRPKARLHKPWQTHPRLHPQRSWPTPTALTSR